MPVALIAVDYIGMILAARLVGQLSLTSCSSLPTLQLRVIPSLQQQRSCRPSRWRKEPAISQQSALPASQEEFATTLRSSFLIHFPARIQQRVHRSPT